MDWFLATMLALVAYLVGSVPTAYIVVRLKQGADIRDLGSRNVGALNTFHQAGVARAAVVLVVDMAKGVLAISLPNWVGAPGWAIYVAAVAVLVGHNWPVFLRFRGGKGAATIFGISLVMLPYPTIIAVIPAIIIIALTKNVVIGLGVGFILVNALAVITRQGAGPIALCIFLSVMVLVTYGVGIRSQIFNAIKTRQLRGVFYGRNLNP